MTNKPRQRIEIYHKGKHSMYGLYAGPYKDLEGKEYPKVHCYDCYNLQGNKIPTMQGLLIGWIKDFYTVKNK